MNIDSTPKKEKQFTTNHNRQMAKEVVYLREERAVNVRPSSQSSGRFCLSSSSTVSLSTSLM